MARFAVLAAASAALVASSVSATSPACDNTFISDLADSTTKYGACVSAVFSTAASLPISEAPPLGTILAGLASDNYFLLTFTGTQEQLQTAFYNVMLSNATSTSAPGGVAGILHVVDVLNGGTSFFSSLTQYSCSVNPSLLLANSINNDFVTACPALYSALTKALAAGNEANANTYITLFYNALADYVNIVSIVELYTALKPCLYASCIGIVNDVCTSAAAGDATVQGLPSGISGTSDTFLKASLVVSESLGASIKNVTTYLSNPFVAGAFQALDAQTSATYGFTVGTTAALSKYAGNCTFLAGTASQYGGAYRGSASSLVAGVATFVAVAAAAMSL